MHGVPVDTSVMAAASHAYCPLVSLDEPPQFTSPSTNSLQCLAWVMRFPELVASTVRAGVEKSSLSAHTSPPTHPLPPPQRETEPVTATGTPPRLSTAWDIESDCPLWFSVVLAPDDQIPGGSEELPQPADRQNEAGHPRAGTYGSLSSSHPVGTHGFASTLFLSPYRMWPPSKPKSRGRSWA